MDHDSQLKLQAFLDGELPEAEAVEISRLVARDPEAAGLLEELQNTSRALKVFETETRLPESREFFWSKLEREIQRLEAPPARPAPVSVFARLRRYLIPASAFAVLFFVGVVLTVPHGPAGHPAENAVETDLADSGAFTYRDYSAGTTLVWLSYPADNEVAENDEIGTVD